MTTPRVDMTMPTMPVRVLSPETTNVLKGYVRDRGLGTVQGPPLFDMYVEELTTAELEPPDSLLVREFEFRGMGPWQAHEEAAKERERCRRADQTLRLAHQINELCPGPWLRQATLDSRLAFRRARIGAQCRQVALQTFAWGMVLAAILSVITAFLARSGASLTPIFWIVVLASGGLGLYAATLIWGKSRTDWLQDREIDEVEWSQGVLALEIEAMWEGLRTSAGSVESSTNPFDDMPSNGELRIANSKFDAALGNLFWSYRDLVSQILDQAEKVGDFKLTKAAKDHLEELTEVEGQFSRSNDSTLSVRLQHPPINAERVKRQDEIIALVISIVTSTVVGFVQLGVPVLILNETSCSYANAAVKIENCDDLVGLDASGEVLTKVNLGGKDLTESNFDGADLMSARLVSTNFTNSSMISANLSKVQGQDANFEGVNLVGAKFNGADLASGQFAGADLSTADFSKTDLADVDFTGANLSGANLSGANLSGANLSGANLSGANLSGANIVTADFTGAIFKGNDLSGFDLGGINFERADFSGANLTNVSFQDANLLGVDISGADITDLKLAGAAIAEMSVRDLLDGGANLEGVDLSSADFEGISGKSVVLNGADLAGTDLSRLDLTNASFDGSSLVGANLSGADLTGASLKGSNLANADLTLAEISTANMDEANFSGADLTDARALDGSFIGAKFPGANLSGADFSGSNLTGATGLGSSALRAQWKGSTCPSGTKQEICR